MAEAHEQQPQARSQPEAAAAVSASASASAIVPASTPAPDPASTGAATTAPVAAEGPAHAPSNSPPLPVKYPSETQLRAVSGGKIQEPHEAQIGGSQSVTETLEAGAEQAQAQSRSRLESESESRAPPFQPVNAETGIAAAHEQIQGDRQDPKSHEVKPSAESVSPLAATTLAASPASVPSVTTKTETPTATATATNGIDRTQHNGHASTPTPTSTSPSPAPSSTAATMSNLPSQLPGPPRPQQHQQQQSMSYAPQPTYPPTSLNTHYGYPGAATQGNDAYRTNPNVTNSAMSLPSMRTFDQQAQHHHQQQQQPSQQPAHVAMAMPHAVAQASGNMGYYQQPTPLASNNAYGLAPDAIGHRYPLPPNDPRGVLAGSRHKKEIKRRTKTGCLTCRKRRIKCDETHPICKNCQKSKRECLGYDPIFKQQQHPTNIQPAPNHPSASPISSAPSSGPALSTTSAPGSAAPYANLPSVLPGPSTAPASNTSLISARQTSSSITKGGGGYPGAADPSLPSAPISINKMRVDELVSMGGVAPPPLESPLTSEKLNEVRDLYEQVYAVGLEAFFETKWYMGSQGLHALASNTGGVNETVAGFLQSMAKTDANDVAGMQYSANLEFRVVWDLACLVKASEAKVNGGDTLPAPDDGSEAQNRVAVFEVLLSGEFLDHNPLMPVPSQGDYHRIREFRFWYYLAEFLRIKDQPNVDMTLQREHILGLVRELLDGRENRDVLYSFAVIRTLSPKFPPDFESTLSPHLDELDPKSKLAVARKFIQDESQVTGGTTNVVRRFSEIAVRAFILPGGNIQRMQG